ncbi:Clavaminate synthase-like protein [Delitschia confertaspora ATCC 74209]|uniref:Clavaminate synthase-like protein n=1 Tax=Delitschia confertaspora ATCC 74209 TaxID=1513339 RepID=A0A9P4MPZ1_9PLEO|nr:Clavaminate synthase-like protein [Delitschia confertaspora ATCC 74209]
MSVNFTSLPGTPSANDDLRFSLLEQRVEVLVQHLTKLSRSPTNSIYDGQIGGNMGPMSIPTAPGPSKQIGLGVSNLHLPAAAHPSTPGTGIITPALTSSPPTAPATGPGTPSMEVEQLFNSPTAKLALKVLDIIQRYGHNAQSAAIPWAGKVKFLPAVESYIKAGEPIKMVLPAFPFKSPNRVDKTLGPLPDLGEELALRHLEGLCESIQAVYEHGAKVVITSDGLVYNDLMGISDAEVWEYSTAVRNIIIEKELKHVDTLRIIDILGTHDKKGDELTREEYLIHAGCYRRELVAMYAPKDFDPRDAVRNDKDICLTYKGYIKFLTKDLMHSKLYEEMQKTKNPKKFYKKAIEELAYKMIYRGKAFAAAIATACEGYVRLSIHPSTGETKLSVPLIPPPAGSPLMTPWHASVVVGVDGSFRLAHADEVRETHDLILKDGRPYYWRERSDLYDFGHLKVEFEHLYPCGLIIRPAAGASKSVSFREVDVWKIRKLAEMQSPVVLRGFEETTDRDLFISRAYELGDVQPWTFGVLQEVKDAGRNDKQGNNVTSSEAMPMHYDGMFKFVPQKDENGNPMLDAEGKEIKYNKPPKFQYFTCIATAPKGSGYTLFAASRLFWKYLPAPYTVERLEKVRWRMDNDGFWDAKIKDLPLVVRHPVHNTPCMRWHEPWPASKTKFSTCKITIENDSQEICDVVDSLLYDYRVCLRFSWEQGDILVSDNVAMLHTRSAFTGDCDREMWRIHFD